MKTTCVALTLLTLTCVRAAAQQPTPMPDDYRKELMRYAGQWITETTIDGVTTKGTFIATMAPGGACLIYHGKSPGLVSRDTMIEGTGNIGWDASAQQLKEVYFNSLGETSTTLWKLEAGRLIGKRKGLILGQESSSDVENVWAADGQEWQHKVGNWTLAGEERDAVSTTFRPMAAEPADANLQQLAPLVGEWHVTFDLPGFPYTETKATYKWILGGRYLEARWYSMDGIELGPELFAWDPVSKVIRMWGFDSETFYEGVWQIDGPRWTSKYAGVRFAGEETKTDVVLEFKGDSEVLATLKSPDPDRPGTAKFVRVQSGK